MHFLKEKLLTDKQLKQLAEHKYSSSGKSILDPLLQCYWNWIIGYFPSWIAPNLITLIGLIINIIFSLLMIVYAPRAIENIPWWACILCSCGLFIYQTLDAIDGKQARRINNCNSLGELFDHGCDSISSVFVTLAVCCSLQFGTLPPFLFIFFFCTISLFYCAHWRCYVSGCMHFGYIDVTEVQFAAIGIHLISSAFGCQIWSLEIPYLQLPLKMVIFFLGSLIALAVLFQHFSVIFTGGIGKNGSTVAGTSVLSPALPLCTMILPALTIYKKSTQQIFENHSCLYLITFGLVAAKITNRLVVAQMTRSKLEIFDACLLGPAILFFNQYFTTLFKEHYMLWLAFLWTVIDLMFYCCQVCIEISEYLRIHPFKTTKLKNK